MAIIVSHRETGARYVLLGADLRMFAASAPLSTAARRARSIEPPKAVPISMLAVSDAKGAIDWIRSDDAVVVEVDGRTPTALLEPAPYR